MALLKFINSVSPRNKPNYWIFLGQLQLLLSSGLVK